MGRVVIDKTVGFFRFRSVESQDKDLFMALRSEASDVADFYCRYPDFLEYNWKQILKDENELNMVVFHEPHNLFVGTCSFQRMKEEPLELGYDVVKEHRGKGIGTKMVGAFFELAHELFPDREIFVRIRSGNIASCRVAEKNGAEFVMLDDPPEVLALQKMLDENENLPSAAEARATIKRCKNEVRVYRV